MIECKIYEGIDGKWIYSVEPDFDAGGFTYPLLDVRNSPEDAGWAGARIVIELNYWYWKKQQLEIQF